MSFLAKFSNSKSIRLPEDTQHNELNEAPASAPIPILNRVKGLFTLNRAVRIPDDEEAPVPLPMEDAPESSVELSRWDRLVLFAVLMAGSLSCYIVSFMLLPVLALKPRKFAILSSFGSILFLSSFAALQGLRHYIRHLFSVDRLWFTVSFITSILFSLVGSLVWKSSLVSLLAVVAQVLAMIAYTVSYFPLGRSGLRMASNVAIVQVDNWLNT